MRTQLSVHPISVPLCQLSISRIDCISYGFGPTDEHTRANEFGDELVKNERILNAKVITTSDADPEKEEMAFSVLTSDASLNFRAPIGRRT